MLDECHATGEDLSVNQESATRSAHTLLYSVVYGQGSVFDKKLLKWRHERTRVIGKQQLRSVHLQAALWM